MEQQVIPTKLDVFNMSDKLTFDVNTPQFLKEACENTNEGVYAVCWNVFRNLLAQVAERATELNDPILNTLMIRLNLYEIPNNERYEMIKKMKVLYNESVSLQTV